MELKSPIKGMPDCWKDEKRMNALFAPFRKKEQNPVDWESKMKFWQTVIKKWCYENNRVSLTSQDVEKAFKRNDKTPNCIMSVIEELLRVGELKNTSEFLAVNPNQSWTSWAFDSVVKTPVNWGVSKFRSMLTSPASTLQPDTSFVLIPLLKERGNDFLSSTFATEKKLFTIKDIVKILSQDSSPISEEAVEHIVHYLQLQKLVLMETVGDTKIVKPVRPGDPKSHEITKAEMAIFKLQQNKAVLRENVSHLEKEMIRCTSEAKRLLSTGMKHSATMQLKKRKRISLCINSRLNALDNLSSLIAKIRSAESDSMVLDAYKSGLAAFKDIFGKSGLSEDDVFDTMAKLQDMNDYQGEIEMAMSQPLEKDFDEDELEEELNDLLKNVGPDNNKDQAGQVESEGEEEEMESTEELDDTLPIPSELSQHPNKPVPQVSQSYQFAEAGEISSQDPHVSAMISMARNFCQQLKDDYDQKLSIPTHLKDNPNRNLPNTSQLEDNMNRNQPHPILPREDYYKNPPISPTVNDNYNTNLVINNSNKNLTSTDSAAIESLDNDFKHLMNLPPVPSSDPMELIYDAQRQKMVEELDRAVKLKKILEAHPPV